MPTPALVSLSIPSFSSPSHSSLFSLHPKPLSKPNHLSFKHPSISLSSTPLTLSQRTPHLAYSSPPDSQTEPNTTSEQLELLEKPSPIPLTEGEQSNPPKPDSKPLASFFELFNKPTNEESRQAEIFQENKEIGEIVERNADDFAYYDPKPGDFAMGVVVTGDENKIDVDIGADKLGIMLKKEVMPLYDEEFRYLLCDLDKLGSENRGKMGIVRGDEALSGGPDNSVVEAGTVVYTEVLGRTLGGRPLLSSRRLFRRLAWHRVREIAHQNEPFEVKIFEWNTGGLLTRIEGLRAFLPKVELMTRINNFTDYKKIIGQCIRVCIVKIDESTNDLIISEKQAWDKTYLKEGTLLQGTVVKIFPFGAQVRIGDTHRNGLLHISSITKARIEAVSDVLKVDEQVKVLVVKSMFPDKIALSISELESEPGLFLSNKEKVYCEAEEMAKKYRQRLPLVYPKLDPPVEIPLSFDDESTLYSNWDWFKFEANSSSKDVES